MHFLLVVNRTQCSIHNHKQEWTIFVCDTVHLHWIVWSRGTDGFQLKLLHISDYLNHTQGEEKVTHFSRPRTWHIVLADSYTCDKDRPLATLGEQKNFIQYTFTMLNPDSYNNATDHFSDEESGKCYFLSRLTSKITMKYG